MYDVDIDKTLEELRDKIKVKGVMITLHNPGGFMREATVDYDGKVFTYRGWSYKEAVETTLDRVRAYIQYRKDRDGWQPQLFSKLK